LLKSDWTEHRPGSMLAATAPLADVGFLLVAKFYSALLLCMGAMPKA
jgi:hypothetical protein